MAVLLAHDRGPPAVRRAVRRSAGGDNTGQNDGDTRTTFISSLHRIVVEDFDPPACPCGIVNVANGVDSNNCRYSFPIAKNSANSGSRALLPDGS